MDRLDKLLEYVRKINPEMTRERLIYELGQCKYSAAGLIMTWQNNEKACKTQA